MTDPSHPFSRLRALRDLPGVEGKRLTETATDEERDIIAKEFNLSGLKNFRVEARIEKEGKTGWRAEGRIIATASQPCVVSLEPVIQKIDESFTRSFIPMTKAETEEFYTNINLDPMADDPPEPLGIGIDIGDVALEAFALALDPYPRSPEASFTPRTVTPPGAEPITDELLKPFAALAALKQAGSAEE